MKKLEVIDEFKKESGEKSRRKSAAESKIKSGMIKP